MRPRLGIPCLTVLFSCLLAAALSAQHLPSPLTPVSELMRRADRAAAVGEKELAARCLFAARIRISSIDSGEERAARLAEIEGKLAEVDPKSGELLECLSAAAAIHVEAIRKEIELGYVRTAALLNETLWLLDAGRAEPLAAEIRMKRESGKIPADVADMDLHVEGSVKNKGGVLDLVSKETQPSEPMQTEAYKVAIKARSDGLKALVPLIEQYSKRKWPWMVGDLGEFMGRMAPALEAMVEVQMEEQFKRLETDRRRLSREAVSFLFGQADRCLDDKRWKVKSDAVTAGKPAGKAAALVSRAVIPASFRFRCDLGTSMKRRLAGIVFGYKSDDNYYVLLPSVERGVSSAFSIDHHVAGKVEPVHRWESDILWRNVLCKSISLERHGPVLMVKVGREDWVRVDLGERDVSGRLGVYLDPNGTATDSPTFDGFEYEDLTVPSGE